MLVKSTAEVCETPGEPLLGWATVLITFGNADEVLLARKMLDDPRRILEVRQRLHLGMAVSYIGDSPQGPPSQGSVVELRHVKAIVQDSVSPAALDATVSGNRSR